MGRRSCALVDLEALLSMLHSLREIVPRVAKVGKKAVQHARIERRGAVRFGYGLPCRFELCEGLVEFSLFLKSESAILAQLDDVGMTFAKLVLGDSHGTLVQQDRLGDPSAAGRGGRTLRLERLGECAVVTAELQLPLGRQRTLERLIASVQFDAVPGSQR